ncbi:MAG TPA: DUF692 family protein [Candidatus Limnocylindrales bacterium]|nr:DUF692 family protein [Candidatus Limnocylindrales bacterium]
MKIGVGYRHELTPWLMRRPGAIGCLELTAEHFYGGRQRLQAFIDWRQQQANAPSCFVHGLGLSLGTPGPLDNERLSQFAEVAAACGAVWVSEHVAFTRTSEADLGHLNPVRPTREAVQILADHALELAERCRRPLLLENITSHVQLQGEVSETEFLNELCRRGNCGLLLDVTNLFVNSRNHRFDPIHWLHQLDPRNIQQLHIVGYSRRNDRFIDDHSKAVQPELLQLASAILDYASVKAIILERDADFPPDALMDAEIAKLNTLCGQN